MGDTSSNSWSEIGRYRRGGVAAPHLVVMRLPVLCISVLVHSSYFSGTFKLLFWYFLDTAVELTSYCCSTFQLLLWYLQATAVLLPGYCCGTYWLLLWYFLAPVLVLCNGGKCEQPPGCWSGVSCANNVFFNSLVSVQLSNIEINALLNFFFCLIL